MTDIKKAILENDKTFFKKVGPLLGAEEVRSRDEQGNSLLHLAVARGSLYFVKHLLAEGADLSLENAEGQSSFHLAIQRGYCNIVDEMLGISAAASARIKKVTLRDKNRAAKLSILASSQRKACALLNSPNKQGEIPLIIAAKLEDDLIYKTLLLQSAASYTKVALDKAFILRKKQTGNVRRDRFWTALVDTLCPSASIAELTETFAYTGLLAGASTATLMAINIAFAALSILGLSVIMYANYNRIKIQNDASWKLESLQHELAFMQGIRTRMTDLASKRSLTVDERNELAAMKETISKPLTKPNPLMGHEKNAADYLTRYEKRLILLSAVGSFLCGYSGALGVLGLGLAVASEVMETSVAALIASTGPMGLSIALGIGLMLAGALAIYHYRARKESYLNCGQNRLKIIRTEGSIFKQHQDLLYGPDHILDQIDNRLTSDLLASEPKERNISVEPIAVERLRGHWNKTSAVQRKRANSYPFFSDQARGFPHPVNNPHDKQHSAVMNFA